MIEIIKELDVEVTKPNIFQAVVAKQYDMNTRFLKVTLKDCGNRIDVPNIETAKVVINAERKDGQAKSFDGAINDDGTVTVPLHSWMLELDGTVICDISVIDTATDDNKKLTTTSFTLLVEKAAFGGNDITSDPQYDVMVELLSACESATASAQEALNISNQALENSAEANSKYEACVEATNNANAVREEIEAGGYIESLKEMNNGSKFSTWVGTSDDYNSEENMPLNCMCFTTDEELADYPIEVGTSGMWTYRKWASGIAECWLSTIYNMQTITITPNDYAYHCIANQNILDDKGVLFKQGLFVDAPYVNYDVGNDVGVGGIGMGRGVVKSPKSNPTKDYTGALYVDISTKLYTSDTWTSEKIGYDTKYTFAEGQYLPIHISVEAKGRWK